MEKAVKYRLLNDVPKREKGTFYAKKGDLVTLIRDANPAMIVELVKTKDRFTTTFDNISEVG